MGELAVGDYSDSHIVTLLLMPASNERLSRFESLANADIELEQ